MPFDGESGQADVASRGATGHGRTPSSIGRGEGRVDKKPGKRAGRGGVTTIVAIGADHDGLRTLEDKSIEVRQPLRGKAGSTRLEVPSVLP